MKQLSNNRICVAIFVASLFWLGCTCPAAAQHINCSAMAALAIPNTEILSATVVDSISPLPRHCWVVGITHGEPGSNVGFDVRLPDNWNGKLLFTTRQGFIGSLAPPSNSVIFSGLLRSYATVSTDSGHHAANILDASFGLNNRPAEIDFGYRGTHLAKVAAAAVVTGYYGSGPVHSYYEGCSSSGRYGIQSAEHYPGDFDGIIAGSPVLDMSGTMTDYVYIEQAMLTAPLPASKLPLIWNRVTAACDGIDGVVDGLIDDPRNCHFDVNTLLCSAGDAPDCLTPPEVGTLKKVYAGAFNSAGEQLFPGFAFGGEFPDPDNYNGWDAYITGSDFFPALDILLSDQYLRYLAFDPDRPDFDWTTFNFDVDPPAMQTMHEIIDPVQDDLTAFGEAGGKMIIYQGWGDVSQSPYRTIQYYAGLRRHVGRRTVENYARLFMAPGMYHCGGGIGPNDFDALTAIERWVEQGHAPSSIIASHTGGIGTDRTRPLCPFPQHAKYKGSGSINDASNFQCKGAPLGTD
jgi:Tannase and feruloyl esterase